MARLKRKINLGKKYSETEVVIDKKKISYPSFYVSSIKLPLMPDDVGKTMKAEVSVELIGIRQETNTNNDEYSYDFEMKSIKFI